MIFWLNFLFVNRERYVEEIPIFYFKILFCLAFDNIIWSNKVFFSKIAYFQEILCIQMVKIEKHDLFITENITYKTLLNNITSNYIFIVVCACSCGVAAGGIGDKIIHLQMCISNVFLSESDLFSFRFIMFLGYFVFTLWLSNASCVVEFAQVVSARQKFSIMEYFHIPNLVLSTRSKNVN